MSNNIPILSPLVFVIYVSDLSDWLKYSVVGMYADDTQSSSSSKILSVVKKNLIFFANNCYANVRRFKLYLELKIIQCTYHLLYC